MVRRRGRPQGAAQHEEAERAVSPCAEAVVISPAQQIAADLLALLMQQHVAGSRRDLPGQA